MRMAIFIWALGLSLCALRVGAQAPVDNEARMEALLRVERQSVSMPTVRAAPPLEEPVKSPANAAAHAEPSRSLTTGSAKPASGGQGGAADAIADDPDAVAFADLKNHVGQRLRISTVTGAEYVVTVLAAGPTEVRVRGRQTSGTFEFTLHRPQISRIAKI